MEQLLLASPCLQASRTVAESFPCWPSICYPASFLLAIRLASQSPSSLQVRRSDAGKPAVAEGGAPAREREGYRVTPAPEIGSALLYYT